MIIKYVFFLDPSLCATCNKGPLKLASLSLLGHCKNQVLLKKYTCIVKKNVKQVLLFEFCPFSNINIFEFCFIVGGSYKD
jgi:hypothetical protein